MPLHRHQTPLILALVVALAACTGETAPASTQPTIPTTTTTTSSPPSTSEPPAAGVDVLALPVAVDTGAVHGWDEVVFLPYGDGPAGLGTSPGGDSGTLDLGPEYGAQAPDGSWWILDVARLRIARFSASGEYIDDIPLADEVLVGGRYVQFQMGRIMADGGFVAFEQGDGITSIVTITESASGRAAVAGNLVPVGDDGRLVYAVTAGGGVVAIDPTAGTTTTAEWMVTQAGSRYRLRRESPSTLRIELPDVGVDRWLPIVSASDPSRAAFSVWEAATTADGRIHLFIYGWTVDDESTQLAGYSTILPDGTVTPVVAVRNPFTPSDPGSPAHLGAAYGSDEPWLMVIDTDGVRIYRPESRG